MNQAQTAQFERTPEQREENIRTDFSEYISHYIGLNNLNENDIDTTVLLFQQDGEQVSVELDFSSEAMEITVEAPETLKQLEGKIYEGFEKFKQAIANLYSKQD